jgi:hypothetical protein
MAVRLGRTGPLRLWFPVSVLVWDLLKSLTIRSKKVVNENLASLVITFNFVEFGNHV